MTCHGDGNVYAYSVSRDASVDPWFPPVVGDPNALSVTPGRSGKDGQTLANPFARWHLGAGPMSCASFSPDGQYLAVAGGADGICRILDVTHWERPRLCGGFKSYYGGLRTVRWTGDGRYVLAGGESDLVEVWAVPEGRYCAAWADGHASWVTCACEDAHVLDDADHDHDSDHDDDSDSRLQSGLNRVKSPGPVRAQDASVKSPTTNYDDLLVTDDRAETLRFGSVGQDCRLCLWDLPLEATGGDSAGGDSSGGVNIPGAPSTGRTDDGFESDGAFEPPAPPPAPVPIPVLPAGTAPPNASGSLLLRSPSGMIRTASKSMLSSMGSMGVSGASKSGLGKNPGKNPGGVGADQGGNGNGQAGVDSPTAASASTSPSSSRGPSRRASLDAEAANEADAQAGVSSAAGVSRGPRGGPSGFIRSEHSLVRRRSHLRAGDEGREVPETLAATASCVIHAEPCTDAVFTEEGVVTACAAGVVKLWIRPLHAREK